MVLSTFQSPILKKTISQEAKQEVPSWLIVSPVANLSKEQKRYPTSCVRFRGSGFLALARFHCTKIAKLDAPIASLLHYMQIWG